MTIFILSACFLFFNLEVGRSYAYSVDCANVDAAALGICTGGNSMLDANSNIKQDITCADCATGPTSYCGKDNWNYCKWVPKEVANYATPVNSPISKTVVAANTPNNTTSAEDGDVCPGISKLPDITWIACVLLVFLKFVGWILGVAVSLFAWIIDAEKMRAIMVHPAIFKSWKIVRDFLNIGFILVLLFSAFSTIFQVDKYNYKKILLWLVIMALLVNFSYPITRFIIDASNVLMYTIMNNFFGAYAGDSQKILTQEMGGFDELRAIITDSGAKTGLPQLLASIVFVFILALTILSMAVLFLIRTIALTILIIFSPVAFIGSVIGKGGQWWDYLFKYALFGPIMVFMLAISINIMKAMGSVPIDGGSESIVTSMSRFVIPIVVLWIGMGVAQKMGIEGASEVIGKAQGIAKGIAKWSGGSLKKSSIAGLKAIDRNTLARWNVSPRQFMAAWKQTTDRAEKDKLAVGTGAWNDRLNYVLSGGKEKTHYKQFAIENQIAEKQKEQSLIYHSSEELINLINKNRGKGGLVAQYETIAAQRTLTKSNDTNDMMVARKEEVNAFGRDLDDKGVAKDGTIVEMINDLRATGLSEQEVYRQIYQIGEIGLSSGNHSLYGAIKVDANGKFHRATQKEHMNAAFTKIRNIEPQELMKKFHPNSLYKQKEVPVLNADGTAKIDPITKKPMTTMKTTGFTVLGEKFLKELASPAIIKQLQRARKDFIEPSSDPEMEAAFQKIIDELNASGNTERAATVKEFREEAKKQANKKSDSDSKEATEVKIKAKTPLPEIGPLSMENEDLNPKP